MKKLSLILSLILAMQLCLFSQTGKVFDQLSMKSEILKMDRNYAVYLPPDYEISQRSYPVLYLLHGAGDDQTGWIQFGEVLHIADKAIIEGNATAMIVVMPDAQTGQRGYFNDISGNWRYEDFFFEEFIPYIESTYRIKSEKQYRAISGLSMGGGGTFMYALHHPELFSSACPLSAYIGPLSFEQAQEHMNKEGKYKENELKAHYIHHSALELVNTLPPKDLKSIHWYIDCGDDDFLYEGNSLIHIALTKKQIPHEYRVRDGAHNWTYWREALPVVLEFVSKRFHQY